VEEGDGAVGGEDLAALGDVFVEEEVHGGLGFIVNIEN
jgi:hypothetical protein